MPEKHKKRKHTTNTCLTYILITIITAVILLVTDFVTRYTTAVRTLEFTKSASWQFVWKGMKRNHIIFNDRESNIVTVKQAVFAKHLYPHYGHVLKNVTLRFNHDLER